MHSAFVYSIRLVLILGSYESYCELYYESYYEYSVRTEYVLYYGTRVYIGTVRTSFRGSSPPDDACVSNLPDISSRSNVQ